MPDDLTKIARDSTRGGFFLAVGNIVSVLISAVSVFVIARILGPEQYGLYSISIVIPSLLMLFINPGINEGIVKYSASLRVRGEEHRVTKLVLHAMLFRLLLALIATLVCFIFSDFFAGHLFGRPEISQYIQIASTLIAFNAVYTLVNSALIGLDKTEYNALLTDTQAVVKASVSSLLVFLGLGVLGALYGYVLGSLSASLVGILVFYKLHGLLNGNNASDLGFLSSLRMLVGYGFPLYLSALLGSFIVQYQSILLAFFASNIDIGNFNAARNFEVLITTLSTSVMTTLFTAFSKLEQESEGVRRLFDLSVKYLSMVLVPIVTFMIFYSNEMVETIYGEAYATASFFLSLAAIQYYFIGFGGRILQSLFNGLGETRTTFKISLIKSLTFIGTAPITTWAFKVPGTITSILISRLLSDLYGLYVAKSKLKVRVEAKRTIRVYLASLASLMPLLGLRGISPLTGLPHLVLGASMFFATYLLLTPLMKVVTKTEVEEARAIFNDIRALRIITKPLFDFEEKVLSKLP